MWLSKCFAKCDLPIATTLKAPAEVREDNNLVRSAKKLRFGGAVAVFALVAFLYADVLAGLLRTCWEDPRASQGLLILPLAAYAAWFRKSDLREQPKRPLW